MNKTLKRILIGLAIVAGIFLISRMLFGVGKKDKTEKVAVEKATRRTIIETVNASGRIYPEVEVKISPDISGQITDLRVEEGDSVKKDRCLQESTRTFMPYREMRLHRVSASQDLPLPIARPPWTH